MKIVEQYIQSKSGDLDLCEDTFYCNDYFAVVIDGATSVSNRLYGGKTPGQLAAETIKEAIKNLDGTEEIEDIIELINEHYSHLYGSLQIEDEIHEKPYIRPSASMIIFSKYYSRIWMIGDCQCFFNNNLYQNIKHVDVVFEEVRSIILKSELMRGKTTEELLVNDIGFNLIRPLIQKQYNFQNTSPDNPLSYGVINGFPIPVELIKTVHVPRELEYISLASDGYSKIYSTLKETEQELTRLLEIDPLCINENISTKGLVNNNISFDDRTYLKVKVR